MTGEQKQQIYILRKRKKSFAEISEIIGIPRNTIKTFCWRSGLTDADLEQGLQNRGYRGFCKNCGKELEQKSKSRPKVYCSDKCRRKWWNEHRDKLRKAPENFRKCIVCGATFHAYPSQKRILPSVLDRRKSLYQAVSAPLPIGNRARTAYLHCIKDGTNIDIYNYCVNIYLIDDTRFVDRMISEGVQL